MGSYFFGPVIVIDNTGQILYQLNFDSNLFTENTSAIQYNDTLYLGTLHDSIIGKIPIPSQILLSSSNYSSSQFDFSIYPNPTKENVSISMENDNGNFLTKVYDLIGNELQITNETTISLKDYAKGVYILKYHGDKAEEVKVD